MIGLISDFSNTNSNEKIVSPYYNCLKEIFIDFSDIRKNILEYIIKDKNMDVKSFLIHLQTILMFFLGLGVKFYIDIYDNINLEIYSDEKSLVNFAKDLSYYLQIRILHYLIPVSDGQHSEEKHKYKCKKQFEDCTLDNPTYFTPYYSLNSTNINLFRKYESDDTFHYCDDDFMKKNCKDGKFIFRNIDKERLIFYSLLKIFDFDKINIRKKDVIMETFIMKNYEVYEKSHFKFTNVVDSFLSPIKNPKSTRLVHAFRNFHGENVGFYFLWVSHYLQWLTYASIISLIFYLAEILVNFDRNYAFLSVFVQLSYSIILFFFGNSYINSWIQTEIFFRYLWGMESFKSHQKLNVVDETVNYKFLNIIIPRS